MSPHPLTPSADTSRTTPGLQSPLSAQLAYEPTEWSSVQAAAIAVAEAVAAVAAAEVAAEAASTVRAAVDTASAAAAAAAARARQVAADAAMAVARVAAELQADAHPRESRSVSEDLDGGGAAAPAGSGQTAVSAAAQRAARHVEDVAAAAAAAAVSAASLVAAQVEQDVFATARALAPRGPIPLVTATDSLSGPLLVPAALSPLTFLPTQCADEVSDGVVPIFVVDDDAVSQVLIGQALCQAGLVNPVVALFDGLTAMAELSRLSTLGPEHVPGLVFLDWQMPGCSGIEVLRWMRASPQFANVPVVMLSGDSSAQKVKQAYDLGASSYLVKPLAFSTLGSIVRGLRLRWQIA